MKKCESKEGMSKMVKDEEYIDFLKMIIACVSHGDYYSIKELSNLELERTYRRMKIENERIKDKP